MKTVALLIAVVLAGVAPARSSDPQSVRSPDGKHPELLQFIAAQKQPWRESKTLSGVIGEHIVMVRQAADGAWLVGAATNEDSRELDIPLTFLGSDRYEALVVEDGDDSDYRTHRESYKASTRSSVTRADKIRVKLAPGGGACLILKKR